VPTEKFANDAHTFLSADLTSGATSLTVTSVTGFPAAGQFRIRIDDEILLVTAVAGTTWTVTRAAESVNGTQTAAAHRQNSFVALVITDASLLNDPRAMTTTGDIEYLNSSGAVTRLGIGGSTTVLGVTGGVPAWVNVVNSFNTRTGAVTLTSSDVTAALGYTDIARLGQANAFTAAQTIATGTKTGATAFQVTSAAGEVQAKIADDGSIYGGVNGSNGGLFVSGGSTFSANVATYVTTIRRCSITESLETGFGMTFGAGSSIDGRGSVQVGTSGNNVLILAPGGTGAEGKIIVLTAGNGSPANAVGIGLAGNPPLYKFHVAQKDGVTAAVTTVMALGHSTTGTAAAGFGVGSLVLLDSSTSANQSAARTDVLWNVATHASRAADRVDYVYYTSTAQEYFRARGASGGVQIGFFAVTPVARAAALTQAYATADRTLSAYTSDPESSAYTGIDNAQAGTPYAQLTDLNALRTAYENLRAFAEDLAQFVNALVDDLQSYGLEQ